MWRFENANKCVYMHGYNAVQCTINTLRKMRFMHSKMRFNVWKKTTRIMERNYTYLCQRRVTRRARRLALAAFQLGSSSGFWSKKVRAQSVKAVENGEPVLPRRTLFWILARSAESVQPIRPRDGTARGSCR